MIVHQPARLHQRIADGAANELEAASLRPSALRSRERGTRAVHAQPAPFVVPGRVARAAEPPRPPPRAARARRATARRSASPYLGEEGGRRVHDDDRLFELLILEG